MDIHLVDNDEQTLRDVLAEATGTATRVRVAVAFAKGSGLGTVPGIEQVAASGKEVRLLAGLDFQLTDLDALDRISRPPSEARVYFAPSTGTGKIFHPKVYVAEGPQHTTAIVGSSNLTAGGLAQNVEANLVLRGAPSEPAIARIIQFHDALWTSPHATRVSPRLRASYQELQARRHSIELGLRSEGDYARAARELRLAVADALVGARGGQSWILITNLKNYAMCIDGGVWGDEVRSRIAQVKTGDLVFFYVKHPETWLAAMGMVTRDPYEDRSVIWPDPRLYPYRFGFELLLRASPPLRFRPLIPQLELFGNRDDPNWGQKLQASMRRLSVHDREILRGALMGAQGTGLVA